MDKLIFKTENGIPGSVRLMLCTLNIFSALPVFSALADSSVLPIFDALNLSDDGKIVIFFLLLFLYCLPGILLLFMRTRIEIGENGIKSINDFILFRFKIKMKLGEYKYVHYSSKVKRFSASSGFRPTAKDSYTKRINEVVLYKKDKRKKRILCHISRKEDIAKVVNVIINDYGFELLKRR